MFPSDLTTTEEFASLKKRIKLKTFFKIVCTLILIAVTTGSTIFVIKYRQHLKRLQPKEIELDYETYPQSIKEALQNTSLTITTEATERFIVPGTKWCGKGTIALAYDDLGAYRNVDICCRDHDLCPAYINSGDSKHGLHNSGFFDWSACDCDEQLRICLRDVNNFVSDAIGFAYFNVLGPKCFKEEYPVIGCQKCEYTSYARDKGNGKRCVKPKFDKSRPKIYQWFDNRLYYS